jgi:catalase
MPLPSDEQLVKLGEEIVATFQTVFGKHPGFRPGQSDATLARRVCSG